jgi:hypothetical protein
LQFVWRVFDKNRIPGLLEGYYAAKGPGWNYKRISPSLNKNWWLVGGAKNEPFPQNLF